MEDSAVGLLVWGGVALVAVLLAARFAVRLMVRFLILGALALAALGWFAGSG